jgi:flagellar hook-length control protein FliK
VISTSLAHIAGKTAALNGNGSANNTIPSQPDKIRFADVLDAGKDANTPSNTVKGDLKRVKSPPDSNVSAVANASLPIDLSAHYPSRSVQSLPTSVPHGERADTNLTDESAKPTNTGATTIAPTPPSPTSVASKSIGLPDSLTASARIPTTTNVLSQQFAVNSTHATAQSNETKSSVTAAPEPTHRLPETLPSAIAASDGERADLFSGRSIAVSPAQTGISRPNINAKLSTAISGPAGVLSEVAARVSAPESASDAIFGDVFASSHSSTAALPQVTTMPAIAADSARDAQTRIVRSDTPDQPDDKNANASSTAGKSVVPAAAAATTKSISPPPVPLPTILAQTAESSPAETQAVNVVATTVSGVLANASTSEPTSDGDVAAVNADAPTQISAEPSIAALATSASMPISTTMATATTSTDVSTAEAAPSTVDGPTSFSPFMIDDAVLDAASAEIGQAPIHRSGTATSDIASVVPADASTIALPAINIMSSPTVLPPTAPTDNVTALPVLDPAQFIDELGANMVWMAEGRVDHIEISLAPPNLGVLEIRLHLDGDRVRAAFASGNADVRSTIEQQVPRLRELLADHGLMLTDAQVGGDRRQPATQQPFASTARSDQPSVAPVSAADAQVTTRQHRGNGLLDEFA